MVTFEERGPVCLSSHNLYRKCSSCTSKKRCWSFECFPTQLWKMTHLSHFGCPELSSLTTEDCSCWMCSCLLQIQEEDKDISIIMTVFPLISILHVFGFILNINEGRKQPTGKQKRVNVINTLTDLLCILWTMTSNRLCTGKLAGLSLGQLVQTFVIAHKAPLGEIFRVVLHVWRCFRLLKPTFCQVQFLLDFELHCFVSDEASLCVMILLLCCHSTCKTQVETWLPLYPSKKLFFLQVKSYFFCTV